MVTDRNLRKWAVILAFAAGAQPLHAKAPPVQELPYPDRDQTLTTPSQELGAVLRDGPRLLIVPRSTDWLATMPWPVVLAPGSAPGGRIPPSDRHTISAKGMDDVVWSGVARAGARILLLNGRFLTLHELDAVTLTEVLRRSIPWDRLRPPRDRGGEMTTPEISDFRARLAKAWPATKGLRVSGMATVPDGWKAGDGPGQVYALSTRLPGFPLLLMECDRTDPSQCRVIRGCHLEPDQSVAPKADDWAGIAVDTPGRRLLLLDRRQRRLLAFRFDSCQQTRHVGTYSLPARLREPTNVQVDEDGRLWLATAAKDDWQDASLYWWPRGSW